MSLTRARTTILCLFLISLSCSRQPENNREHGAALASGERASAAALAMLGRPYRFGGATPSGFDCSGLVSYCYQKAGLQVPHGTDALKRITHPVQGGMRKGDLLFFDENGREYSHVAIYAGKSRFIHAAAARRSVRIDSLLDPYWKERFLDARRF